MGEEQNNEYNFSEPNDVDKVKVTVPASTLRNIQRKAGLTNAALLNFIQSGPQISQQMLDSLVSAVGDVAYIIGAIKYYIGDKNEHKP